MAEMGELAQALAGEPVEQIVETLAAHDNLREAATAYGDLMRRAYWHDKQLARSLAIATAGIDYCQARAVSDVAFAAPLLGTAKMMAYNVAANTWVGWDDPLDISAEQEQAGLDAALLNLQYAYELDKPPLPLSRGHWMLAAQQLAHGQFDAAAGNFAQGVEWGKLAGSATDMLLNAGFFQLVQIFRPKHATVARTGLASTKAELNTLEKGAGFVDQLDAAERVFAARFAPNAA